MKFGEFTTNADAAPYLATNTTDSLSTIADAAMMRVTPGQAAPSVGHRWQLPKITVKDWIGIGVGAYVGSKLVGGLLGAGVGAAGGWYAVKQWEARA